MDTALMLNEITHSALLFDSTVKAVTSLYFNPISESFHSFLDAPTDWPDMTN